MPTDLSQVITEHVRHRRYFEEIDDLAEVIDDLKARKHNLQGLTEEEDALLKARATALHVIQRALQVSEEGDPRGASLREGLELKVKDEFEDLDQVTRAWVEDTRKQVPLQKYAKTEEESMLWFVTLVKIAMEWGFGYEDVLRVIVSKGWFIDKSRLERRLLSAYQIIAKLNKEQAERT